MNIYERDMNTIYQQRIMDHYKYPRNKGKINTPDIASGVYNPSCGDASSITACVENEKIRSIAFDASGCVISIASASLLTEYVKGKSLAQINLVTKNDLFSIIGIPLGPTRLKCALLPLEALQKGIEEYTKKLCLIEQK